MATKKRFMKGQIVRLKRGGFPYKIEGRRGKRVILSAPLSRDIEVEEREIE